MLSQYPTSQMVVLSESDQIWRNDLITQVAKETRMPLQRVMMMTWAQFEAPNTDRQRSGTQRNHSPRPAPAPKMLEMDVLDVALPSNHPGRILRRSATIHPRPGNNPSHDREKETPAPSVRIRENAPKWGVLSINPLTFEGRCDKMKLTARETELRTITKYYKKTSG